MICEVIDGTARFGKWVWNGNMCSEHYTYKDVTEDFNKAFEEITRDKFNNVWGNRLQKVK